MALATWRIETVNFIAGDCQRNELSTLGTSPILRPVIRRMFYEKPFKTAKFPSGVQNI